MDRGAPLPLRPTANPLPQNRPNSLADIIQSSPVQFREAITALLKEREATEMRYKILQDKLSYVRGQLIDPYARRKDMNRITPDTIDDILRDALNGETLRRQVGMLQNEVRRLRWEKMPKEEQVRTNGRFNTIFRHLSSNIHDLAAAVAAKPNANPYTEAIFTASLVERVPRVFWQENDLGSYLLEAFTWSALLDLVFASPFCPFFSDRDDYYIKIWTRLFGSQHDANCQGADPPCGTYGHAWPIPSEASERWKASTFEALTLGAKGPERTVARKAQVGNRILGALDTVVAGSSTDPQTMETVRTIINEAFMLAEQIGMQWERVQIWVPRIGDTYPGDGRPSWAKRLRNVVDGGLTEGRVFAIISPGLVRWGYEKRSKSDEGMVMVPSGVLLEGVAWERETSLL